MKGKLCVITGATSGIGRATAMTLGALGADLVLLGRNEAQGKAIAAILSRLPQAGKIQYLRTDLAATEDVRKAAATISQLACPVDVLINNAGARLDHYQQNSAGHELTFATNHLGHFLLTGLLLDRILAADQGRIITVSSGSHGSAQADGTWELTADNYDRKQAYAKSKLANILFAYELARRVAGTQTVSCAVDPGGVASNFARNNGLMSWAKHLLSHALRRELISPQTAAQVLVELVQNDHSQVTNGGYYRDAQTVRSSPASYDQANARSLWAFSLALTGSEKLHPRYAD